jgi:hypothetical protein
MHKQILLDRVKAYNKSMWFFMKDNFRIAYLKQFLATPAIVRPSPESNIPFDDFLNFMRPDYPQAQNLFTENYLQKNSKSASLFRDFSQKEAIVYKNTETFFYQALIADIPADKLVILDGYAFDSDELAAYAENHAEEFYKNPHILDRKFNQEYSEAAKTVLRNHPTLNKFALALDKQLAEQKNYILPETVDAVITMLQTFHERGEEGSIEARAKFLEHKFSLTEEQQKRLDSFIIEVPTLNRDGVQRMNFQEAFTGGDDKDACILTVQVYLWQFVVTMRPESIALVPEAVKQIAFRTKLLVGGIMPQNAEQLARDNLIQENMEMLMMFVKHYTSFAGSMSLKFDNSIDLTNAHLMHVIAHVLVQQLNPLSAAPASDSAVSRPSDREFHFSMTANGLTLFSRTLAEAEAEEEAKEEEEFNQALRNSMLDESGVPIERAQSPSFGMRRMFG